MKPHRFLAGIERAEFVRPHGVVRKVSQGHVEASGPACTVGEICEIVGQGAPALMEVVAAQADGLILMPLRQERPVQLSDRVYALTGGDEVPVGSDYAGRAVDAFAMPIDAGAAVRSDAMAPLSGRVPRVFDRADPKRYVVTGLRAIDGLLTLGEGQRIGIFAASGVGKTSLIEQLAIQTDCDRCVICLVGERGREVEGIWRHLQSREDRDRFTLVAATSDESASLRARSTNTALCLAEYWRDQGEHVLLVIDSVTRFAMALREIGLAAGEPPTMRAYTPNVFAALPRLVERCGATRDRGSITAIMTVLSETDDVDDPIVEVMKSLLDGHVVLSRSLAEKGHFPAIDISKSISRQSARLITPPHAEAARAAAAMLGVYEESRIMIESGVYKAGTNQQIDRAVDTRNALMGFLQQRQTEHVSFDRTVAELREVITRNSGHA